jgi:transposase
MHTQHTINQFIELRAQNISIRNIADQIGVHRNTLLQWQQKYADEIDNLRAVELEAIQERVLPKYEEQLTELVADYKRVTEVLRNRDYGYESCGFLAWRQFSLLSRIDKMRILPRMTPPKQPDEPAPNS